MAIALVGATNFFSSDTNGFTSTGIDTSGANFIVISLSCSAGTGSISDSKGNTWTQLTEYTGFFGTRSVKLFYAYNATVGTGHTFTVSGSAGLSPAISLAYYSGVESASDPLDTGKVSGASNNSSTTIAPGSLTPTTDGSLIVTGLFKNGSFSSAPTIDASFTREAYVSDTNFGHFFSAIADLIQTTAAAANPTWTISSDIVIATMAVFKAASGGGGGSGLALPQGYVRMNTLLRM